MGKLKVKLLTCELSHIYLRYDCQNRMFLTGLFPVRDFIIMCGFYLSFFFLSFILSAVGKTVLSVSFWRSKCML